MSLPTKLTKLTDYTKNKENPFMQQAVEKIQNNIVKKYKNSAGYGKKAVLRAVDDNGEVVGHTTFIRQVEIDEQKFTKLYLAQFSQFWDLKNQAMRVFGYIMTKLIPKQDMFIFLMSDCLNYTGYKGEKSVYIGLASLVENEIIARGPSDSLYFINPMVAFNGDRVTFAKTYVKKQKSKPKEIDPNQTSIFDIIKFKEEENG